MIFLGLTVSLPLSLLRSVDSLSGVAMGSLLFYSCLLIRVRGHPRVNGRYFGQQKVSSFHLQHTYIHVHYAGNHNVHS